MAKILVTGAGGQLGKAFQAIWPEAIFVDKEQIDLAGSPADIEQAVVDIAPDLIIHGAAYTAVDAAEESPGLALQVNSLATGAIAVAARKLQARLVYISTDYVLADTTEPKGEDTAIEPKSIYGYSKWLGEEAVKICPDHHIIRTSWVFGEGQNFVLAMLGLGERESLDVVDDQIGRPTYALDLANCIKELCAKPDFPKLLHIQNSGDAVSWAGFAKAIFAEAGLSTKVTPITAEMYAKGRGDKPTAIRPANSVYDMAKLADAGIAIRPWPEALKAYLATQKP